MTDLEFLVAVRDKIATPAQWCKGLDAVDANGKPTGALCTDAVAFCIRGAAQAAGEDTRRLYDLLPGSVVLFNDHPHTTHAMVMNRLDYAIARAIMAAVETF